MRSPISPPSASVHGPPETTSSSGSRYVGSDRGSHAIPSAPMSIADDGFLDDRDLDEPRAVAGLGITDNCRGDVLVPLGIGPRPYVRRRPSARRIILYRLTVIGHDLDSRAKEHAVATRPEFERVTHDAECRRLRAQASDLLRREGRGAGGASRTEVSYRSQPPGPLIGWGPRSARRHLRRRRSAGLRGLDPDWVIEGVVGGRPGAGCVASSASSSLARAGRRAPAPSNPGMSRARPSANSPRGISAPSLTTVTPAERPAASRHAPWTRLRATFTKVRSRRSGTALGIQSSCVGGSALLNAWSVSSEHRNTPAVAIAAGGRLGPAEVLHHELGIAHEGDVMEAAERCPHPLWHG